MIVCHVVGITVSDATISLRITATGVDAEDCARQIDSTRNEILQRVGELHFGDGEGFELQHAIERTLKDSGQSLLTIEFGHAAVLSDWFASLGKTPAYRGGLAFFDFDELVTLMGVPRDSVYQTLQQRSGADWLLVVDSYPTLECAEDQPFPAADVSLVVIAPNGQPYATTSRLGGHPSIVQARIAKAGMAWLRRVFSSGKQQGRSLRTANQ